MGALEGTESACPRGVVLRGGKDGERLVLSASGVVDGRAVLTEPVGRVEIAIRGEWTVGNVKENVEEDGEGKVPEAGTVTMIGGLPEEAKAPLAGEKVLVSMRGVWHVVAAPSMQGRFLLRVAQPAAAGEEVLQRR